MFIDVISRCSDLSRNDQDILVTPKAYSQSCLAGQNTPPVLEAKVDGLMVDG